VHFHTNPHTGEDHKRARCGNVIFDCLKYLTSDPSKITCRHCDKYIKKDLQGKTQIFDK
jgi:hypothetical protein